MIQTESVLHRFCALFLYRSSTLVLCTEDASYCEEDYMNMKNRQPRKKSVRHPDDTHTHTRNTRKTLSRSQCCTERGRTLMIVPGLTAILVERNSKTQKSRSRLHDCDRDRDSRGIYALAERLRLVSCVLKGGLRHDLNIV
jgi:hypothetical protein